MTTGGRKRKTTETSFTVIESLRSLDGARVSEVASAVDLSMSAAHEHLATLEGLGYVTREGDEYHLGLKFTKLGRHARYRTESYRRAEEYTERIGRELGWRSNFVVEEGGKGVFLHLYSGEQAEWEHEKVANRQYLHNTATGKAILAHLPEKRCEEIFERWGLPETTDRTITDRDALYAELETIRERGYAVNRGENIEGIKTMSVPALDQSGRVLGSFSITVPAHVGGDDWPGEEVVTTFLSIVNEFELELELT